MSNSIYSPSYLKAIKKENKTFQNLHLEKEEEKEEEEGKHLNTVSERGMETGRYRSPALPQSEETGSDRLRVSGRKRESDKE